MEENNWIINLTWIDSWIFRTMNWNADEMIAVWRVIKAWFPCSRVDVTNAKYDAIVDIWGAKKLLRIQIKWTWNNSINFTGGTRSWQQISREVESRKYKYSEKDCDLIIWIDTNNWECYIIPINEIKDWWDSKSLMKLQKYKENWHILIDMAKDK
jgi:hypothetical protein